jgi:hypothetical protein
VICGLNFDLNKNKSEPHELCYGGVRFFGSNMI